MQEDLEVLRTFADALVSSASTRFVRTLAHTDPSWGGGSLYERTGSPGGTPGGDERRFVNAAGIAYSLDVSRGHVDAAQFGALSDGRDRHREIQRAMDSAADLGIALRWLDERPVKVAGPLLARAGLASLEGGHLVLEENGEGVGGILVVRAATEARQPLAIRDMTFDMSDSRIGIHAVDASDLRIENNRFEGLGSKRPTGSIAVRLLVGPDSPTGFADCDVIANTIHCIDGTSSTTNNMGILAGHVGSAGLDAHEACARYRDGLFPESRPPNASRLRIRGNTIRGGYYGIGLYRVSDSIVEGNRVSTTVRGISAQQNCMRNVIARNRCVDTESSGIHLAFGSSDNRILDNHVESSRADGQALLQSYVGTRRNAFVGNFAATRNPAPDRDAQYLIYAAVDCEGSSFVANVLEGTPSRAVMAIESDWLPEDLQRAHRWSLQGNPACARGGSARVMLVGNSFEAGSGNLLIAVGQRGDKALEVLVGHQFRDMSPDARISVEAARGRLLKIRRLER